MGSDELKLLDGLQTVPVLNTKNQSGSVQITALTFRLCQDQSYATPPKLQTLSQKLFTIIQVFSILQYLQVPCNKTVNSLVDRCTLTWEKIPGGKETLSFAFSSWKRPSLATSTPCNRSDESEGRERVPSQASNHTQHLIYYFRVLFLTFQCLYE